MHSFYKFGDLGTHYQEIGMNIFCPLMKYLKILSLSKKLLICVLFYILQNMYIRILE